MKRLTSAAGFNLLLLVHLLLLLKAVDSRLYLAVGGRLEQEAAEMGLGTEGRDRRWKLLTAEGCELLLKLRVYT